MSVNNFTEAVLQASITYASNISKSNPKYSIKTFSEVKSARYFFRKTQWLISQIWLICLAASMDSKQTNHGKGCLILRSIRPEEVHQYFLIRSDPKNNVFHPYLDPDTFVKPLKDALTQKDRQESLRFQLFILSKTKIAHANDGLDIILNDKVVIGVVEIALGEKLMQIHHPRGADAGIIIHHPFAGQRYGKEALIAVLDYVLLCKANLLHDNHLTGLNLDQITLDTEDQNTTFIGLMNSLGLSELQKPARA
ncbi:hypothetical protein N431DRAFT_441620 [Stipitochalara longipes BDJ]|nr:hypothetical protein N431DRAFT_441620 [Stipitochalara longipes BDJ]